MKARPIIAAALPAVAVGGIAYVIGRSKLDELLKKSVVVTVADNAPSVVKLALGDMRLSVKVRDIYDAATKPGEPGTLAGYFKVTLQ